MVELRSDHNRAEAPAVWLLHGWGVDHRDLGGLRDCLERHADASIQAIDFPGFGDADPPPAAWGSTEYANWLRPRLREPCVLVGHSFGARVALQLAADDPKHALVRGVVLIAGAGLPRRRTWRGRIRQLEARTVGRLTRISGRGRDWFIRRYGSADYRNAGPMRPTLVRVVNEDLTELASRVTQPCLLLWGQDDTETPVESGRRYGELLRDSRLIVMPGKGHFPHSGMGAQLCAHYILPFLQRLGHRAEVTR